MAKKDRTGNRKSREQRKQFKVPECPKCDLLYQVLGISTTEYKLTRIV